MKRLITLVLLLNVLLLNNTFGQYRCGSQLLPQNSNRDNISGTPLFESWLLNTGRNNNLLSATTTSDSAILYIPVVFHIIYKTAASGSDTFDIPDSRLVEQIQILNNDFQRIAGSPGFNTNPLSANSRIEFRFANRNPQGAVTNGIVRVNGERNNWELGADMDLKALSCWPTDKYLNVWIVNSITLLGWAQYPPATNGNPGTTTDSITDGVVVKFSSVGNAPAGYRPYHRGRTLTHEIGHYLGLLHVWGDQQDCNGNDFCADTPPQSGAVERCPSIRNSCASPNGDLIPNYMQYTDDTCMNMFTADQVLRMRRVLRNAPRRLSLLTSPGLVLNTQPIETTKIGIYPNPTSDRAYITGIEPYAITHIQMVDVMGRKWVSSLENNNGELSFSVSQMPKGLYFIEIENAGKHFSFRIIVK